MSEIILKSIYMASLFIFRLFFSYFFFFFHFHYLFASIPTKNSQKVLLWNYYPILQVTHDQFYPVPTETMLLTWQPIFHLRVFSRVQEGTWAMIREVIASWGTGSEDEERKKKDMKPWLRLLLLFLLFFPLGPNSLALAFCLFNSLIFISKWIIMNAGSSGNNWPSSVYNMSLNL